MNINILNKFIDKTVELFINGISHIGILTDCRNEGVLILKHRTSSLFENKLYGEMYVSIGSIDAIREYLAPTNNFEDDVDWDEEWRKIKLDIIENHLDREEPNEYDNLGRVERINKK